MDGVSTAVGLATTGYTAYTKVTTTLKEYKKAPEQLQSLEDDFSLALQVHNQLVAASGVGDSGSHLNPEHLQHLYESAERSARDFNEVSRKVKKKHPLAGMSKRPIRWFKWLLKKNDIKDSSNDASTLLGRLTLRWHLDNSRRIATSIENLQRGFEDMSQRLEVISSTISCTQLTPNTHVSRVLVESSGTNAHPHPSLDTVVGREVQTGRPSVTCLVAPGVTDQARGRPLWKAVAKLLWERQGGRRRNATH